MKEQIVNFETMKLAYEKGFSESTQFIYLKEYLKDPILFPSGSNVVCGWMNVYPATTQSFLQKWLRERHNIYIEVYIKDSGYGYELVKTNCESTLEGRQGGVGHWDNYESALEAALYEALELIK